VNTHTCPAPGCTRQVPRTQFACRTDWYRLPEPLRDAVWAGYRAGPLGDQHTAAMADAIDWYAANPRPGQEEATNA
jgi:hypothetical protein